MQPVYNLLRVLRVYYPALHNVYYRRTYVQVTALHTYSVHMYECMYILRTSHTYVCVLQLAHTAPCLKLAVSTNE